MAIIMKFIVSLAIFFTPKHARVSYLNFFSNLWPLYHPFTLVRRRLHLLLLSLQTVGLGSQARVVTFHSTDCFQYSYPISISATAATETEKGQACATNLLFKKVISWQNISMKTMSDTVRKMLKQRNTFKKCCGKFSKPAQLLTCCCANSL